MQEPLRRTGDIPEFDSYPAPVPGEEPVIGRFPLDHELPPARSGRLNATAERIGSAVGSAVGTMRRGLHVMPRRVGEARERLSETGGDLREDALAAAIDLKETAQQRIFEARLRTRRYMNENPFQVVAAAAGAGFAIGVALRIWRWKRE
jgi:ElaB/YqjD/DUF883 family membrane-anchored ribosome-binding protein